MNRLFSGMIVSLLSMGLTSPVLAQSQRPSTSQGSSPATSTRSTANEVVCNFQYTVGNEEKQGSASGTTRLEAKEARNNKIDRLEEEANQQGQDFEVTYQLCRDPFGNN